MIKKTISLSFIIPALACGPDTIVVIPQDSIELPVTELEYLEAPPVDEELFYAERIVFEEVEEAAEEEAAPEEEPVQEEPPVEEEPIEEQPPVEEEPVQEEPPVEEEPVQEEPPVEEEPAEVEEEPVETEEPVEEEPVEEPSEEEPTGAFSGECNLEGNIYNFQSICISPLACLSRHVDNFEEVPETGFCGKICFGDINCPGDTQCVMNGVTPGVGYCER